MDLKEAKKHISPEAFQNLEKWLTEPGFSDYKQQIEQLLKVKNWKVIDDSFYTHIRIGTGGIRGELGVGPNRVNNRTIGEAAQGLANFINDFGQQAKEKGVVVSHEVRKNSLKFAELTCSVLAANGIKTFLFDGIRATPEVSFAVRYLKTTAGVQLTASHNPRTDNGFKFFWSDGGQVVPPLDERFMKLVSEVESIKFIDFEKACQEGFVKIIGKEIDEAYFAKLKELSLVSTRSAKIAFSPLNSSVMTNALPILKELGYDVTVLEEQAKEDETFPGAYRDYINPEFEQVLQPTTNLGEKIGADIAICTDPDGCRFGASFKKDLNSNKLYYLTANEIASCMIHFIATKMKEENKLSERSLFIKTFNSTTLASDIARSFGMRVVDDLFVGYKWIGQVVEHMENSKDFVFSFEDTCGYCRGDFIRDKDGAIGALTAAELVSFLKDNKKTIVDYLNEIYSQYGYYRNVLYQVEVYGKEGFEKITKLYKAFRTSPPKEIGGLPVLKIIDRLPEEKRKPENYRAGTTGDEVTFILSEDERIRVLTRPSGTQPQFKYYTQVFGKVDGNLEEVKKEVDNLAQKIEDSFYRYQDEVLGKKERGLKIISHF
jgi:phosphomannomutase